jgi:hypothetical protein
MELAVVSYDTHKRVLVICDCEGFCLKLKHKLESKFRGQGARCFIYASQSHLRLASQSAERREFGNTNYNILIQRAEEARALIAKIEGETK